MKKADIYEIAIKILGIYLFFSSHTFVQQMFMGLTEYLFVTQNFNEESENSFTLIIVYNLLSLLFVILFAYFLTFKTKSIVKYVCKSTDFEENSSLFAPKNVIYEIAIVVMGLILIVWTLPELLFNIKNYLLMIKTDLNPKENYDKNFIYFSSIKVIIGFLSVYFAQKISLNLVKN